MNDVRLFSRVLVLGNSIRIDKRQSIQLCPPHTGKRLADPRRQVSIKCRRRNDAMKELLASNIHDSSRLIVKYFFMIRHSLIDGAISVYFIYFSVLFSASVFSCRRYCA